MSQKPSPIDEELLTRIKEELCSSSKFDEQEIETIKQMVSAYRSWLVLGGMVKWFVLILSTAAAGMVAFDTIVEKAQSWLKF